MITQVGQIVAIEPDCLWVEALCRSTCHSCSAKKGCGLGILSKIGGNRQPYKVRVLLGNHLSNSFSLGDDITIGIPERALISAAFAVYLLPLLILLVGALLGSPWGNIASFVGGVVGFIIGLGAVKLHANLTCHHRLQPIILVPHPLDVHPINSLYDHKN